MNASWQGQTYVWGHNPIWPDPNEHYTSQAYKPPFPAVIFLWVNKTIESDKVYSDTPAIDDSSTSAQSFLITEY